MSKQTDYTPEEWKAVSAAPVMAGLLVTVSDLSGPIGTAKEAIAVVRGVMNAGAGTSNDLIKAVAEGVQAQGGKPEMPDLPGDRAAVRTALIDGCKQALSVVMQKSPAEAEEYRLWLTSIAQQTAEASKEGGFLGIGGVRISEAETAAVNELTSALSAKA